MMASALVLYSVSDEASKGIKLVPDTSGTPGTPALFTSEIIFGKSDS
jgi:hypothetical protein